MTYVQSESVRYKGIDEARELGASEQALDNGREKTPYRDIQRLVD